MGNDTASFVISIIALLISVVVVFLELICNIKINNNKLKSDNFNKLYSDILMYDFPHARAELKHTTNMKITGKQKMMEVLRDLRKKSIYFKYNDEGFYNGLIEKVQDIEDILSREDNLDMDEYSYFSKKLEEKIKSLYSFMNKKFFNKNIPRLLSRDSIIY